jgi:predicted nucleotidyltransferase
MKRLRPLDSLFSQPQQRLLATVLCHPDMEFGTRELLSQMGNSHSAGATILKRWVESGLLRERRVGNQRRLAVNPDFILYPELRQMALKTVGLAQPLAEALAPVMDRLHEAFVFGSVAAGKDTTESDIDLVIVGDVDLFTVSPLLDPVQQQLGRPIHASIYGVDEWLSKADPILESIKSGPRINLMGELRGTTN